MAFFKPNFLSDRRLELQRAVHKFQYQLNGTTWLDGTINEKTIEGNAVVVFVDVPSSGKADTITGARFYDANGRLGGEQALSLARKDINSALIRFVFPLDEGTL